MKWPYYRLLLPLSLLILWLVLNETFSIGQIVLGGGLAVWLGWAAVRLRPLPAKVRNIGKIPRLFLHVSLDIFKSNIAVAKLILSPKRGAYSPGFISIPIDMRDPHGLAMLACIVTYTPGTVWVDISPEYHLTLHVLDLQNEAEWVTLIKERYERPLMEIFE